MKTTKTKRLGIKIIRAYQLYLMLLVPLSLVIVFCYYPMYGAQIALKKYNIVDGIMGSPWVGLMWFEKYLGSNMFLNTLWNTLVLNLYSQAMGFPLSIILAISLTYLTSVVYKKVIQMVSYAPYFISTVVLVGIMFQLFNPFSGVFGKVLSSMNGNPVDIFLASESFRHIFVWSGVWQGVGYGSIMYISVLSSVSPELHEAAIIDGATIFKRIVHIDIPALMPTIVVMLILSTGSLLNTGFEKVLLLQNSLNLETSEVIDTYSYKIGLSSSIPNYSLGTAIGLFKSVVCFGMMIIVNKIAQKMGGSSLW